MTETQTATATAYPLSWPIGQPRTAWNKRQRARFDDRRGMGRARDMMLQELARLGATGVTISTNLALRNDGLPRAGQPEPKDPGVAVYFKLGGQPHVFASDRWDRVADNMWAIKLHIEALRGTERWGVGRANQAFAGYRQLMAPPQVDDPWWEVLQCPEHCAREFAEDQYRRMARQAHPDAGGSHEMMARLNRAIETAREYLN
jgi:hypothetical protein